MGRKKSFKIREDLPEGIVAESWEVSCHPDGQSVISNGQFKDMLLSEYIRKLQYKAMGIDTLWKPGDRFPLLVKLIDANSKLSVQVHPDDRYASLHENDKSGKNEMWYIIWAKPGAKLVYGLKPGTTKEAFKKALENGTVEEHLNYIEVSKGDAISIPAGIIHAIGEGIMLAEVQQNSNNTYRVYDYNRVDKDGNMRPLHIQKALDVIDFSRVTLSRVTECEKSDNKDIIIQADNNYKVIKLVENRYFSVELHQINGEIEEAADGSRFYIYLFIEGEGTISYGYGCYLNGNMNKDDCNIGSSKMTNSYLDKKMHIKAGESIFIPASMGEYKISGNIKAIKMYVPNL